MACKCTYMHLILPTCDIYEHILHIGLIYVQISSHRFFPCGLYWWVHTVRWVLYGILYSVFSRLVQLLLEHSIQGTSNKMFNMFIQFFFYIYPLGWIGWCHWCFVHYKNHCMQSKTLKLPGCVLFSFLLNRPLSHY